MKKDELKTTLLNLSRKDNITKEEVINITPYMMENIGSVDSELRDDLIYSLFAKWATSDFYSSEQLVELLYQIFTDDKLFYKIGEINTDSVFTRTFSCLLIPVFLYINNNNKYLSDDQVLDIYENIKKYFKQEQDLRGYINDKGWAHSVAHTADAFLHISEDEIIDNKKQLEILYMIKDKIHEYKVPFIQSEDERLVEVISNILSKNKLTNDEVVNWIKSISDYEKLDKYPEDGIIKLNVKTFLRSLYFKLIDSKASDEIINLIIKTP